LGEGLEADGFEIARNATIELPGWPGDALQHLERQSVGGTFKRQSPREQLVQDHAEAVNVAPGIGLVTSAGGLLRGHVGQSAEHAALGSRRGRIVSELAVESSQAKI